MTGGGTPGAYCPNCRAPIDWTGRPRFCVRCGAALGPPPGASAADAAAATKGADGAGAVTWSIPGITLAVAAGLVALLLASLAAVGIAGRFPAAETALTAWLAAHFIAPPLLGLAWLFGPRRHILAALGFRRPRISAGRAALLTAAALAGSLGFTALYAAAARALDLGPLVPEAVPPEILFGGAGVLLSLQGIVLLTPLVEEVFFRGFIFAGLRRALGPGGGMLLSAVIFSGFHLEPSVLLPILVTGLLLAWLYHQTGSLWPPIAAHAAQNALALLGAAFGN